MVRRASLVAGRVRRDPRLRRAHRLRTVVGERWWVAPSVCAAVLWARLRAAVCGLAGPLAARPRPGAVSAVAKGAWTMLLAGLALASAGLLVLAAVRPSATRACFEGAFRR